MDNQNLEFNLPQNAYVSFDATSLKSFMIEQLNNGGVFTDQNYEGSNISGILDILAYYTHVLMFYLNQTSSESMFSQATIYENMNRIVKMIGYKPGGRQTSICSVNCLASSSLPAGSYNIRKYSYFLIDNIQYTFINDFPFEKITNSSETITSINDESIIYQGVVGEYPVYTAIGEEYETFPIVVSNLVDTSDTRFISHGSISVYVKEKISDTWHEYIEVDSLFLTESTDRVYDLRLNENGNFEVKFGNGIFGRKLTEDDQIAVFYILSDGDRGIISKNAINGNKLFTYNSLRFNEIYDTVKLSETSTTIDNNYSKNLTFNNPSNSTVIQQAETVDQMRENTPSFLSTQIRLVTELDYEKFIKKSVPNILNDVKVVNNDLYISQYIQYFYDICVDPNKVNRVLINQVNFADPCDFNNINIFIVPSFNILEDSQYPEYISNSLKVLIKNITDNKKMIGSEIVPRDPIYMAIDLGYTDGIVSKNDCNDSKLVVVRSFNNKKSKDYLKNRISDTILNYFNPSNVKLGATIDISSLTSQILSIDGIRSIKTENAVSGKSTMGLSFIIWNPMFDGVDETLVLQTNTLQFFKFPYLYNPISLIKKIEIVDE